MNKKGLGLLCAGLLVLGQTGVSQAALYDRGGGLIYDDILDITWLSDANYAVTSGYAAANAQDNGPVVWDNVYVNGTMGWDAANTWAASLSYGGFDDWRLPTALNQNGTGPCLGYDCTNSEMGHMFYNNLGVVAKSSILSATSSEMSLFSNIQSSVYWVGTQYAPNASNAWFLNTNFGHQYITNKHTEFYAWAVRSGDIAPVPLPAAVWLFGSGLVGLGLFRRKVKV